MSPNHPLKKIVALATGALLASTAGGAVAMNVTSPAAHADLMDGSGQKVGEAHIVQHDGSIAVMLSVTGLTPGQHGAHIHMTGQCDAPDFKSAGGHWNPTGVHHGLDNPEGHHFGDMPNLDVQADGSGTLSFEVAGASIDAGDNGMLDADGAAIVIHAGPDDMKSDPAGNSGGRIACGVISRD